MYYEKEIWGFSITELRELLISSLAITFIFVYPKLTSPGWWLYSLFYFVFIGLGFVIHESSHKFMAKSRGAWSEFRMWSQGLLFALFMRIVGGPVFIAPGATLWAKRGASVEDYGVVSVVGPISNIILSVIFFLGSLFVPILLIGTYINLQLAMFNLLPIPPLDGSKVIKWNPLLWGILFLISLLTPKFL